MDGLNYHHLFYFWAVVRDGSIAKASKTLRLAPATISGQIRALERSLDQELFERVGRSLVPTATGRVVYRYAEEIFGLGRELQETLMGRPTGRSLRFRVGVADVVPKLIAHRLLAPIEAMDPPVQLVCREARAEQLMAELSIHTLDMVLTDAPMPSSSAVRVYHHPVGSCGVSFFAAPGVARRLRGAFPKKLATAPMLVPAETSALRRALDHWLALEGVSVNVSAEFDDSALMKVFGQHGAGVFPGPSMIEKEIEAQYGVVVVGRTTMVKERFYAVTVERRVKHPAAAAVTDAARRRGQRTCAEEEPAV